MCKKSFALLFAFFISIASFAQQDRKDRIITSYLIAFGHPPQQSEIDYWMTDPLSNKSLSELIEKHRQNMSTNKTLKGLAIQNSYLSAMGKYPELSEKEYWMNNGNLIYAELYDKHVKFLSEYKDNWRATIILSYQQALNRTPEKVEIDYWMNQTNVRSMADLKAHHYKNSLAASKTKKPYSMSQMVLTSQIKKEVKAVITTIAPTTAGVISTGGLNVISTGGGNVISTGGGNVISTGGGNVISTGGLN
jgi:hypothetical protein